MSYIVDYGLREAYKSMKSMDKLAQIDPMINWESLRLIVKRTQTRIPDQFMESELAKNIIQELYRNDTDKGGRPNIDEIVMIKLCSFKACTTVLMNPWRGNSMTGYHSGTSSTIRK